MRESRIYWIIAPKRARKKLWKPHKTMNDYYESIYGTKSDAEEVIETSMDSGAVELAAYKVEVTLKGVAGKEINKIYRMGDESSDIEHALKDATWAVYNYENGGYDGRGDVIYKYKGQYYHNSLVHCSCYGPASGISFEDGDKTLSKLKKRFSLELVTECKILFSEIKTRGLR